MYTSERFDLILSHVKRQKRATVAELSRLLFVSEATVRRDLSELQKLGLLRRTHGGVICADTEDEVSIFIRKETNDREKEETAAIALTALPEFQTIFIDNSSTCLALAERMNLRHKVVMTNGLRLADSLLRKDDVRILMPGGELRENTGFADSMTCSILRGFHFDLMLISCAAIGPEGCYENTLSVKEVKATVMELSDCRILLAGASKLGRTAPYRTSGLSAFDYVFTNAGDEAAAPYRERGVQLVNAPREG